jgi:dUTP pyrophosphatase
MHELHYLPIHIKFLSNYKGPKEGPKYGSDLAAAFDFNAGIEGVIEIAPGETKLIPAGFSLALPASIALLPVPRSGLALKFQVGVGNSPGVVDADYRGEVGIIVQNLGSAVFTVYPGDRIAQGLLVDTYRAQWLEVDELPETERGSGGFGSTGVQA